MPGLRCLRGSARLLAVTPEEKKAEAARKSAETRAALGPRLGHPKSGGHPVSAPSRQSFQTGRRRSWRDSPSGD